MGTPCDSVGVSSREAPSPAGCRAASLQSSSVIMPASKPGGISLKKAD